MRQNWTEEEVTTLKTLWNEKVPCRIIADALAKSRNAIIGKAQRLGLEARKEATRISKPKPAARVILRPRAPPAEPQKQPVEGVSILEVRQGQCRAIIGSSNDSNGLAVMCGEQTYRETPWCEDHFNRYTTRRS